VDLGYSRTGGAAGHDPQLEKAIQMVMEELKANPSKKLVRPPFPVRVK
jgi:tricorn protease